MYSKHFLLLSILIAMLNLSCSDDKQNEIVQSKDTTQSEIQEVSKFAVLEFLPKFNYEGNILKGLRWRDKLGENFFIITEGNSYWENPKDDQSGVSQFWYGYHVRNENNTGYKVIRKFTDSIIDCPVDRIFKISENGFFVDDKNRNDIGEIYFTYEIGCKGGIDPHGLELLVIEDGNKYSISGSIIVIDGSEKYGGDINPDKNFKKADSTIQDFAMKLYKKCQISE